MATPTISEKDAARFERYLNKNTATGCWLWTGCTSLGYGSFRLGPKTYRAHRIAVLLSGREIPERHAVMHNCPGGDNRACCNPAHLLVGTAKEHYHDMVAKRQLWFQRPDYVRPKATG